MVGHLAIFLLCAFLNTFMMPACLFGIASFLCEVSLQMIQITKGLILYTYRGKINTCMCVRGGDVSVLCCAALRFRYFNKCSLI